MSQIVRPLQVNVVAAYYGGVFVGDLFGNAAIFSGLSGTAFGVVQGIGTGIGAGFFGGFVASGGNVKAALTGAVAGAFTGGVAGYYGSNYPLTRVASNAVASGVSAKIQGGDFMDGLRSGLITSAFTFGNVLMRQNQIASSLGNPINDGTGLSNGMFGDFFKLAGERLNQFQLKLGDILGGPLGGTQN